MSSQIPYCGLCQKEHAAQMDRKDLIRDARQKGKGQGRAKGWGPGSDESENGPEDEWGGGLPGIMKASSIAMTVLMPTLHSPISPSLAKLLTPSLTSVCFGIGKRLTSWW